MPFKIGDPRNKNTSQTVAPAHWAGQEVIAMLGGADPDVLLPPCVLDYALHTGWIVAHEYEAYSGVYVAGRRLQRFAPEYRDQQRTRIKAKIVRKILGGPDAA
jgi:hypothetical protein